MNFNLKDFSYGLLLGHTFSGLVALLGILAFQFDSLEVYKTLAVGILLPNAEKQLFLLAIFIFIVSTVLGFIIDGAHHLIYDNLILKKLKGIEIYNIPGMYDALNTEERMKVFQFFIKDDLWYPAEAYANFSIGLIPFFLYCSFHGHCFIALLLFITILVMGYEAYETLIFYYEETKSLIGSFKVQETKIP